ncbi:MAG: chromate transporter [Candidatus Eremiobacteraeota bacterium]|nr:chromate transporter [Candidatus Eremiobacteraeota bacterium]
MTLCAYGLPLARGGNLIHRLLLASVAVVADAIVRMTRTLVPDLLRVVLAVGSFAIVYLLPTTAGQLGALAFGALAGAGLLRQPKETIAPLSLALSWRSGAAWLAAFGLVLAALPFADRAGGTLGMGAAFFRAGSLVFGGGHVVLPLLQTAFVPAEISDGRFLAGYGAAQLLPGPLFTFAAYLGAALNAGPGGWLGAALATCAIFAPSFFLLFGIAPFWRDVRSNVAVAAAVRGLGAAVVGLLAAAFIHPIWTSAIHSWIDVAIAALAFAILRTDRVPAWGAVIFAAVLGGIATLRP